VGSVPRSSGAMFLAYIAPIIIIIGSLRAFPNGTCLVCALHGKVAVFRIRNLGLKRRWARLESLPTILHREDRNLTPAVQASGLPRVID
jgi:hypothetical protein